MRLRRKMLLPPVDLQIVHEITKSTAMDECMDEYIRDTICRYVDKNFYNIIYNNSFHYVTEVLDNPTDEQYQILSDGYRTGFLDALICINVLMNEAEIKK